MYEWLLKNMDMRILSDLQPLDVYGKVKIMLNGRWIGICSTLYEPVQMLRNCRRLSIIPLFTSISYNVSKKVISIYTDNGLSLIHI